MRRAFGQGELREQILGDSGAGLVPVEEIVAKGLDDVIERTGDMRDAWLAQECVKRTQYAARGADLDAVGGRRLRRAKVRAKDLVSAVDEVDAMDGGTK